MVCMHPSEKTFSFIFFKDAFVVENVTVVGGCLGSGALRMEQPAAIYRWSTEGVLRIAVSDSPPPPRSLALSMCVCVHTAPHIFLSPHEAQTWRACGGIFIQIIQNCSRILKAKNRREREWGRSANPASLWNKSHQFFFLRTFASLTWTSLRSQLPPRWPFTMALFF